MPGILESWVVALGWDASAYNRGRQEWERGNETAKEKAKKDADEMEAAGRKNREQREKETRQVTEGQKQIKEGLSEIRREAVQTAAVLLGANGLKDYIANTVTIASNTERMAKAAGVGVQDLSAFGDAIRRNGGDAESAKRSIAGLAAAMTAARTMGQVSPEMNAAFGAIGASFNDDPLEVFAKFAGWAEGKDPRLVAQTGGMLGLDEASINEAMKGRAAVERNISESRRLGAMNDEQAKKLKALQEQWRHLTDAVKGNALAMLVDAAPAMTSVLAKIDEMVQKYPDLTKLIIGMGVALTTFGGAKMLGLGRGLLGGGVAGAGGAGAGAAAGAGLGGTLALGAAWGSLVGVAAYAVHPTEANKGEGNVFLRSRRAQVIEYFMNAGWTEAQARGIAAGIEAENGKFDPTARPIDPKTGRRLSSAYGLGQHLTARSKNFSKLFPGRSIEGSSFHEQLAFINWELTNPESGEAHHGARLRNARTAAEASTIYLRDFMRPGAGLAGDYRRASRALQQQSVTIQNMTVNTQARDGSNLARDFKNQMSRTGTAAMATSGVN